MKLRLPAVAAVLLAGALNTSPALAQSPGLSQSKVLGAWDATIQAPGGDVFEATLTFSKTNEGYAIDFADDDPAARQIDLGITELKVTDTTFSFLRKLNFGEIVDIQYTGKVEGDKMTGEANSPYGPAQIVATRLP